LSAERPVEHVAQQREPAIDGRGPTLFHFQIVNEILDLADSDSYQLLSLPPLLQYSEPLFDFVGGPQSPELDVPLQVQVCKRVERHNRRRLRVESSCTDGVTHPLDDDLSLSLRADLLVRPPRQARSIDAP